MNVNYIKDDFQFNLRTSAVIYNSDKTKVLLFNVDGRSVYLLPGGRVEQLEKSKKAISREIEEELGYKDLEFELLGISEEFVNDKGLNNHQINIIYKTIYQNDIQMLKFKGLEGSWINFEWVSLEKINDLNIFPKEIKECIINPDHTYHIVDNLLN